MAEESEDWAVAFDLYQDVLASLPSNRRARVGVETTKLLAVQDLLKTAQTEQTKNRWARSEELISSAFQIAPEVTQIGMALAHLQLKMGYPEKTLETTRQILEASPNHAEVIGLKARAIRAIALEVQGTSGTNTTRRKGSQKPQTLADLRDELAQLDPGDPAAVTLQLALFQAHEDRGEFDTAFGFLAKANQTMSKVLPYEFTPDALEFALTKNLFHVPLPSASKPNAPHLIFVTGLAQTGVSLAADLLRQNETVDHCRARLSLDDHIGPLLQAVWAGDRSVLTPDDLHKIRNAVLSLLAIPTHDKPVFVDCSALSFRWIGYICAAFPEARMLHVNHEPIALGWSLFRQTFRGTSNAFAYSFESIATYLLLHRNWMDHWRRICPDYMMEIDYAALIHAPESTAQRIAEFIGVEWSRDWKIPSTNYKDSRLNDWANYTRHLEPLKQALKSGELI